MAKDNITFEGAEIISDNNSEMANNETIETLQVGDKVHNIDPMFKPFERVGEIIMQDGKMAVRCHVAELKKTRYFFIMSQWRKLPADTPSNVLETILSNADIKPATDIPALPETDKPETKAEEIFQPLSDEEKTERKKLETEYKNKENVRENAYLRQCEIIHILREKKLFRDLFKTFEEYARGTFQVTREYAQQLAQIGAFYAVSKDYIKDNKLSVNSIIALARNQNKLAAKLNLQDSELADFKPVLEKVLESTIEASKDAKGKVIITPRIVDAVSDSITNALTEIDGSKKTGLDLITLAAAKLGEKANDILTQTKESLTAPKKESGSKSTSNDTNGFYTGALPVISIECSIHGKTKLHFIGNGCVQFGCLCKARLNGFETQITEVKGQKVKTA